MYRYDSPRTTRDQEWIAEGIGCYCGMGGILVSSLPFVEFQELPFVRSTGMLKFHAACITCRKQGMVAVKESQLPRIALEEGEDLLDRVTDYMWIEKGCDHRDFWCISRSIRDPGPDDGLPKGRSLVHLVFCAKCRKRGPLQLTERMSDIVNGKER